MARLAFGIASCVALVLGSATAGEACGLSFACPPGPAPGVNSPTSPIETGLAPFVPPIALQQIETASAPIALPAGPPPASDDAPATAFTGIAYSGDGGIASLADLDRGIAVWQDIEPVPHSGDGGSGGLGQIGKVAPASHRKPQPPKTEQAIGMYLAMEIPVPIRLDGVPGIAAPFLASGNRALWFAPDGTD